MAAGELHLIEIGLRIDPELVELEKKIVGALDQALNLELQLFQNLVDEVLARGAEIIETAHSLAALDVAGSRTP